MYQGCTKDGAAYTIEIRRFSIIIVAILTLKSNKKPLPGTGSGSYKYIDAGNYMMSRAFTKEVHWKGRMRVSHSQCSVIAAIRATEEAKNTNHHMPVFFFCVSMQ